MFSRDELDLLKEFITFAKQINVSKMVINDLEIEFAKDIPIPIDTKREPNVTQTIDDPIEQFDPDFLIRNPMSMQNLY